MQRSHRTSTRNSTRLRSRVLPRRCTTVEMLPYDTHRCGAPKQKQTILTNTHLPAHADAAPCRCAGSPVSEHRAGKGKAKAMDQISLDDWSDFGSGVECQGILIYIHCFF